MSATTSYSKFMSWKHLKVRYVAGAGALAIAASALIAVGPWRQGSSRPVAAAPVAAATGHTRAAQPGRAVIYLTGSRSEAALLEGVISSERASLDPAGEPVSVSVLVVDSPEREFLAAEAGRELMQFGVSYEVIDLRAR